VKEKLNVDYNNKPLMCFAPNPNIVSITAGTEFDVFNYHVVCFSVDVDFYFNLDESLSYAAWPANRALQLTNKINYMTVDTDCQMMIMWGTNGLDYSEAVSNPFLQDGDGKYLTDSDGEYLISGE